MYMKKTSLFLSLAALAVVGCNKAGTGEAGLAANEPMVFSASTAQTKAVFADGDDGTLEWSAYDNLGVYSFDAANAANPVHSGFAAMKSFTGSEAVFTSGESRATWAGGATDLHFYAYYPQLEAPYAPCVAGKVTLNVPTLQNGEFGKYQICYGAMDISAEDLTAGEPVDFAFAPKTSMLRVRPVLSADSDVDEIVIKQVIITIADDKKLAGDCQLTLATGNLAATTAFSALTVNLPEAVTITKTAANNAYFTAVILPAAADNAILSFNAVAADGTRFTMANKLAPAAFQPSVRYNIDREIKVEITPDGTPDGKYVDAGYAWSYNPAVEDGAYTDGGAAW